MSPATPPSEQTETQVRRVDPTAPYHDSHGFLVIPSPIPGLPKPLGLLYRNYNVYFSEHSFVETTGSKRRGDVVTNYPRALVACTLVPALLRHYFPSSEYTVQSVWPGYWIKQDGQDQFVNEEVISEVPVPGTCHYAVSRKSAGEDADKEMVALVVIVTDPDFFQLEARRKPTRLQVVKKYLGERNELVVDGLHMSDGPVVLLSGTWNPMKPAWEFYKFESSQKTDGHLVPWVDRMTNAKGSPTNSVSLAAEDAHKMDAMFEQMVRDASVAATPEPQPPQRSKTASNPNAPPSPVSTAFPTRTPTPQAEKTLTVRKTTPQASSFPTARNAPPARKSPPSSPSQNVPHLQTVTPQSENPVSVRKPTPNPTFLRTARNAPTARKSPPMSSESVPHLPTARKAVPELRLAANETHERVAEKKKPYFYSRSNPETREKIVVMTYEVPRKPPVDGTRDV